MTARDQLENLTLLWILYCLGGSALGWLAGGLGWVSLGLNLVGAAIGVGISLFIGRLLVGKSQGTRFVLSGLAAVFSVLGVLSIGKLTLALLATWSLGLLVPLTITAAGVAMNVRSLRVLWSARVRRYFA